MEYAWILTLVLGRCTKYRAGLEVTNPRRGNRGLEKMVEILGLLQRREGPGEERIGYVVARPQCTSLIAAGRATIVPGSSLHIYFSFLIQSVQPGRDRAVLSTSHRRRIPFSVRVVDIAKRSLSPNNGAEWLNVRTEVVRPWMGPGRNETLVTERKENEEVMCCKLNISMRQ